MHKGKYVFSQLLDFLDKDVFLRIANKYNGNRYVKQLTCYNQLAVLMFGQLSNRESLRDVVLATQAFIRALDLIDLTIAVGRKGMRLGRPKGHSDKVKRICDEHLEIERLLGSGCSIASVARRYNVHRNTIMRCRKQNYCLPGGD